MSKAMNLRQWRQSLLVPDGRGGTRSMTQKELAKKVGVGNSLISRIESGERWPSRALRLDIRNLFIVRSETTANGLALYAKVLAGQAATWRAYDPSRKGKRP